MQKFGGHWTEIKLLTLKKYLHAYRIAMKKQPYRVEYIDAFAGTGYRTLKQTDPDLLGEDDSESETFLAGSATIALNADPPFHGYVFIEKDKVRFQELTKLKTSYPQLSDRIELLNGDSNPCIATICKKSWRQSRALMFLDPFGMQVTWESLKSIANTEAIDLWLLFPLGVAVSRLLKKDGKINPTWRHRLDVLFGTNDWYDAFYETKRYEGLFGPDEEITKTATSEAIGRYFVGRLNTIFPGVLDKPIFLKNSKGCPLYLLCFAISNPSKKAISLGLKIANDIVGKKNGDDN